MKVDVWPSILKGRVSAPGSKSDAQRMVACALLAKGTSTIHHFPVSDDCEAALQIAQDLGAVVIRNGDTIQIKGGFPQAFLSGIRNAKEVINCGESGLASRMFASIAALSAEPITVTGKNTLLKRPFMDLVDALRMCGVKVESDGGLLPLHIQGPLKGGSLFVDASLSSQFLTGLLIALSRATEPSVVLVKDLKSRPYIDLTMHVLSLFGAEIINHQYERFEITPRVWKGVELSVPGDWSGGAFLLIAGALCAEEGLLVDNLDESSPQADKAVLLALSSAGVRFTIEPNHIHVWQSEIQAFEFDATHCPDLFPPLAAMASFANGVSIIKGVSRLTHKESNRAKTLQQEFAKSGIRIVLRDDEMKIYPAATRRSNLQSHNDHRIAMAGALLGLAGAHTTIVHAEAVSKSFPGFFSLIQSAGARVTGAL